MSNQSTFVGLLYSRNLETGNRKIHGTLFCLQDFGKLSFDQLPELVQERIYSDFTKSEKKIKNITESLVSYNQSSQEYEILFSRVCPIHHQYYLNVMQRLVNDNVLEISDVLKTMPLHYLSSWIAPRIDCSVNSDLEIISGQALTFGAKTGVLVSGLVNVKKALSEGKKVIMIAGEMKQEDLEIFPKINGIILTKSGPTSHAAVIAKGMGIPSIITKSSSQLTAYLGSDVTLDADKAILYKGILPTSTQSQSKFLNDLMKEASKISKFEVASNADTKKDSELANSYFARGIGLCRTEHMFLTNDGRKIIRKILFSDKISKIQRQKFLKKQKDDFYQLFITQANKYVVIRLLDAPLHEFLSNSKKDRLFHEQNPMLGFRGARFLLQKPEVMRLQIQAVCEALKLLQSEGKNLQIKFELPMVMDTFEIDVFADMVKDEVSKFRFEQKIDFKIGTMIEIPRSAYLIDAIAPKVDFISFGTNDLTQMFCGLSRDDSESFLGFYQKKGVFRDNPFISLDEIGVGQFLKETANKARIANPKIEISVCGEQAACADSIKFLISTQVDTISCSASRIPMALFASAKYSLN